MNRFRTASNLLRYLLPGRVRIQGSSMEPTYRDGDWLMVRWSGAKKIYVNDVVVAEREEMPGIYYIKRATKIDGKKYWLSSDNPAGTDSRAWGWVNAEDIRGKVLFRYFRKQRTN